MNVVMLLCDAAQAVGGKLYILGGGWSAHVVDQPLTMGVAVKVGVPWNLANQRHKLAIVLISEDGKPMPEDNPFRVEGEFEVGRPPGVTPGTTLNVPFAVNVAGVPLPVGGYRVELSIDGTKMCEESFVVVANPSSPRPAGPTS